MRGRGARAALLGVVIAAALVGCAGARIEGGIYQARSGYRVAVPGDTWAVVDGSRADIELRHRTAPAGMLANAVCEPAAVGRSLDVLTRHLLLGLRDRVVVEAREISVNGRLAAHAVVEGRMKDREDRVRIESYVLVGERCVYDLVYVASPPAFDAWRPDFQRLVDSFVTE